MAIYTCAGCGNAIDGDTMPFITVTDFADLHASHDYGGYITRFIHDYHCLSYYASLRHNDQTEGRKPNMVELLKPRDRTVRRKQR